VKNSFFSNGTPYLLHWSKAFRNSGKESATDQKRWQISKNDLCRFDSQFSIESKNEIKLGRLHLKKPEGHNRQLCPRKR
jgi:hypothetical protein